MIWLCSLCGRKNPSTITVCSCGNTVDELPAGPSSDPGLEESFPAGEDNSGPALRDPFHLDTPVQPGAKNKTVQKTSAKARQPEPVTTSGDEIMIKEVNAWRYVYSMADECIHMTTSALPGFRITLSSTDLEELLEVIAEYTGTGKTLRNVELSKEGVREIVEHVGGLIEERRSKIRVKLNAEDLERLGALINDKLKT